MIGRYLHAGLLAGALCNALTAAAAATGDDPTVAPSPVREPMRVVWYHANRFGDGVTVSGFVRRTVARPGPLPGFIRVTVGGGPDGAGSATRCLTSRDLRPAGPTGGTFAVHFAHRTDPAGALARYADTCSQTAD